jgi:hypothetical protein
MKRRSLPKRGLPQEHDDHPPPEQDAAHHRDHEARLSCWYSDHRSAQRLRRADSSARLENRLMKTATFLQKLPRDTDYLDARLYRVRPSMTLEGWGEGYPKRSLYVVVSGSKLPGLRQPETFIFLADDTGKILDWLECDGSFQGSIDHAKALKNAGYDIVENTP